MFYPNRTLCCVLEEMRKIHESRNYAGMLGLIEEVQVLANRMEAALSDRRDLRHMNEMLSEKKAELKKVKRELDQKQKELKGENDDA